MKYHLLLWLIVLSLHNVFALSTSSEYKNRVALVIGNAAYDRVPLSNPVNDATDMADVLKKLGFEVILKTDANLQTMVEATREFRDRLTNGNIGVFYYSGHGNQSNNNNYLIPLQAKIEEEDDFKRQALSANEILEKMEDKNRDGINLIFLDACRSNLGDKKFKSGSASKGLASMGSRSSGSLVGYATTPGEVVDDNPKERNSIYTKHLLAMLREMPQKNIFTLLAEVRLKVKAETSNKQIPREENALTVPEFCLALDGCEGASLQGVLPPGNNIDSDGDGVNDNNDLCPGTLAGVSVDGKGCPIQAGEDNDRDGVPDTVDKCLDTPFGTKVDRNGCTVPIVVPIDNDYDGVPDAVDKCLDTPFGIKVDRMGCTVPIIVPISMELKINFDSAEAVIKPLYISEILKVAKFMTEYPNTTVTIEGHTDSVGEPAFNQKLSERRANAVREVLVENGISASRIRAVGYGAASPIADNATVTGRAQNRRMVAVIEGTVKKQEQ